MSRHDAFGIDEYIMMRLAQMIYEGAAEAAIDRAVAPTLRGGNIGGKMLEKNAARLKEALRQIKLEEAEPYVWKTDESGKVVFD